jgi:DNA modification methylase
MNQLILGDCLEVMRKMDSESIDLIYLDPPFFSNRNYEVIWGDKGEVRSFEDRWSGGIDHYISWLKERVSEMHRLLKPTGSIYLHCDWHAFAEIKVYVLDKLFNPKNFINAIVWNRSSTRSSISRVYRRAYDTLYFYSKSDKYSFNQQFMELSKASKDLYNNKDEKGFYQTVPLLVSGKRNGETGKVWRNIDPNKQGKEGMHWVTIPSKLDEYEKQGLIYWPGSGGKTPRLKYYIEDSPGVPANDFWNDIKLVSGKESIGYPTQKPEALLDRIIQASSNEGDIILDPFVGGGTSVVVADKLGRNWIGIDQSVQAVKVSEFRLNKQQGIFSQPFVVQLHKYDYDTLRYKDAFQFEAWIVDRFGGISNLKQRGDFGIDGKSRNGTPIQVKRSDNIGRNVIDNFQSALMRYDKALYEKNKSAGDPVGFIIAFSFGKGAVQEVARLKNEENIIIKLVTVEEIVPIAKKPKLNVAINDLGADGKGIREIEFKAEAESDAGIEFYSFDFSYNPEEDNFNPTVVLDRTGTQTYKFKPGYHAIAVKAVDSEGLEAIEVIKIKVNGEIIRE